MWQGTLGFLLLAASTKLLSAVASSKILARIITTLFTPARHKPVNKYQFGVHFIKCTLKMAALQPKTKAFLMSQIYKSQHIYQRERSSHVAGNCNIVGTPSLFAHGRDFDTKLKPSQLNSFQRLSDKTMCLHVWGGFKEKIEIINKRIKTT